MNYTSRFGLEFNPFIKLSRDILIETANYDEVKARLDYLTVTKGMGLITGDPGCGKTTIIRNWVKSLNQSAYKIIYLPLSTLTVMESYRQLAQSFNLEPRYKKYENLLRDSLNAIDISSLCLASSILDWSCAIRESIFCSLSVGFVSLNLIASLINGQVSSLHVSGLILRESSKDILDMISALTAKASAN